jgi:hypothetical protein
VKLTNPYKLYAEIDSLKFNLIDMTEVNYEFDSLRSTLFQQVLPSCSFFINTNAVYLKALYELLVVISSCSYKVTKNDSNVGILVKHGPPQSSDMIGYDHVNDVNDVNGYIEGYRIWSVKGNHINLSHSIISLILIL